MKGAAGNRRETVSERRREGGAVYLKDRDSKSCICHIRSHHDCCGEPDATFLNIVQGAVNANADADANVNAASVDVFLLNPAATCNQLLIRSIWLWIC